MLDRHDYEESLRGIFSSNGKTRLRYQKTLSENVVVKDTKTSRCGRFSRKIGKFKDTICEFLPWLTVIPFMQPAVPIEPEGELNDVDCDALEQKF